MKNKEPEFEYIELNEEEQKRIDKLAPFFESMFQWMYTKMNNYYEKHNDLCLLVTILNNEELFRSAIKIPNGLGDETF